MVVAWGVASFRSRFCASVRLVCLGVAMTPEQVVGRLFEEVLAVAGVGEAIQGAESRAGRERSWDDRRCQAVMKGGCVPSDPLPEGSAFGDFGGTLGDLGLYPAAHGPAVTETVVAGGVEISCVCRVTAPPLVAGRRLPAGFRGGTGGDDAVDGLRFKDLSLVVTAAKKTSLNGKLLSEVEGRDFLC